MDEDIAPQSTKNTKSKSKKLHEQSQEDINSNNQDSPHTHITPNSKRGAKGSKISPESSIGNQNSPGSILNKDPSINSYKPPQPIKKNYVPS